MSQTNAQKTAIDPNISARVSANAGTGKTHILVNRFLRLLLAGSHPNRILCLTYTKAAAAEMSERITKKLKGWVLADEANLIVDLANLLDRDPNENELLRARQLFTIKLQSMPPPRIQTIHSFCQEVLSQFTLEAGLSHNFTVMDELTASELLDNAKKFLLSNTQNQPEFLQAINYIAEHSSEFKFDEVLSEVISNRNNFRKVIDELPDEDIFIEKIYKRLGVNRGASIETLEAEIADFDQELITQYLIAIEQGEGKREQELVGILNDLIVNFDANKYSNIFLRADDMPRVFSQLMTKKTLKKHPELEEMLLDEQDRVFNLVDKMKSLKIAEFTEKITILIYGFVTIYEDLKFKNNSLDYEDLIYYTLKLFEKSDSAAWILYKLDGGVEHVLVDEAQDTSPEQWQIVSYLVDDFFSGDANSKTNRTIFIVGDEKQSIYSFQGAEPKSFGEVASQFAYKAVQSKNDWMEISLKKSFRSVGAVLQLVDNIFQDESLRQAVSFNENKIEHEIHRSGQGGIVELWPLQELKEKEKIGAWEPPIEIYEASDTEAELAKKIAKTIKSWFQQKRVLKATNKEIQPQDIMILLRKRGSFANKLIREMKKADIPVAGSDRLSVTKNIAVIDLISFGNFLLLPEDDYSLACALKSPIFNISENELFELCYDRGSETLFNNIHKNNTLKLKLNSLLEAVKGSSPYEIFSYILDKMGCRKNFISRLGDEVNDPLNEFLELCLEFEETHNSSLQEFLIWLVSEEVIIKRDMEQGMNKVRVLTVHASKGLQAPIVFLPDTVSTTSSDKKTGNNIIWKDDLFFAAATSKNYNHKIKSLNEQRKNKEEDEYFRLLYVAMTRASDELYIAGVEKQNKLPENCWYNIIKKSMEQLAEKDGEVLRWETEQEVEVVYDAKDNQAEDLQDIPDFYFKEAQALT